MSQALVSVIIPAYNAGEFIETTIKGIVEQHYSHWELIIVDDGSTDDTPEKIKPYLKDPRIQYLHQKNSGVSQARNLGFKNSSGNFIAFLDADDCWLPDNISEKVKKFESGQEYGLVHSDMKVVDEYLNETGETLTGNEGFLLDELLLSKGCSIPAPSSILVKREVVAMVQGFDSNLSTSADLDFFLRVAQLFKIGRVDKALGLYRKHPNNMHLNIQRMEKDNLYVYQKAERNNMFHSTWFKRRCFSNMYMILAGSWWINASNKKKGLEYIFKSVWMYPPAVLKLLKKLKPFKPSK